VGRYCRYTTPRHMTKSF